MIYVETIGRFDCNLLLLDVIAVGFLLSSGEEFPKVYTASDNLSFPWS